MAVGTLTFSNLSVLRCALFLESCMRAQESVAQCMLEKELRSYFGVDTFETCDISKATTWAEIGARYGRGVVSETWNRTKLLRRGHKCQPNRGKIRKVYSIHMSNAKEIQQSILQSQDVYTFGKARSWLDITVPVLNFVKWSPECSQPRNENIDKILPPLYRREILEPWPSRAIQEEENA